MKFQFLSIASLIIAINSFGQLEKNTWLVGGTGSLYSYNQNFSSPAANFTAKYTNIDISTSIGYFIANKFASGLRPFFTSEKGSSSDGSSTHTYKFGIGPYARYYFLKNDKKFNLLADVSYLFGINKFLNGFKEKGKYNTLSILGGTEIFFNSNVGLEFLLGYRVQSASIENSPSSYTNNRKGFQTSIGFQFHLEKN